MHEAFAPPAPEDTPTIAAVTSTDSTLRATGTEFAVKRIDGTTATGADVAGDPAFLFDGTFAMDRLDNAPEFVRPPLLPGGDAQGTAYSYAVETVTDAANTEVEFMFRPTATSMSFRAYVNGRPMSLPQQAATGLTAGQWTLLRFVFPTAKSRRIRIAPTGRLPFAAAYVPAGESLTRPEVVGPRVAILGDSYEGGAGSYPTGGSRIETAGVVAAHMLGAGSIWNFGIGGTGYAASSYPFHTRVAEVLASKPDILIISGSVNDGSNSYTALRDAVRSLLASVASVPEVYVTGPSLRPEFEPNNSVVREETIAAGRPYLDPLNPLWMDEADMIGADTVHPTKKGHIRRANKIAEGVLAAREFVGFDTYPAIPLGADPSAPVASVVFSDDFNRPDADTLGAYWTVNNGTAGIRSNAAGVLTIVSGNTYVYKTGAADGVLKATVASVGGGGPYLLARGSNSMFDRLIARNLGGNWAIQNVVNSSGQTVHQSTTPVAVGDKVEMKMQGPTVTLTVNGTQVWSGDVVNANFGVLAGFAAWESIKDFRLDDLSFENLPA
jgi:lysophospholipase L1-like esterase